MAYVIPTIYRAVDNMTGVQAKIGASMTALTLHATRMQRTFNALTPSFSAITNNMLELAKGAVTASAAIGAIAFSGKALLDYEEAVQSFRTIVSDLNDTEFAKFQQQIGEVANQTKKSSIDVAKSFEVIAGLNAQFAQTADGLGQVSKAVITLAKASRMELAPAAESLVAIMNQFDLQAMHSDRAINVLAAGQAVGAANISQSAEALANFGAVAKAANISLEQSIGLIQTLGAQGQIGSDVGSRLRTTLLKIQQTGFGYSTGKFDIEEALLRLRKQYEAFGTEQAKNAYLTKVFGAEQVLTGTILINNIGKFKDFTQAVTGTGEAYKAAEINSNTLMNRIDELKNKWVTLITTSEGVGVGIKFATSAIQLFTDNLENILAIAGPVLGFYATYKAYIIAINVATKIAAASQVAFNYAQAFGTIITGRYTSAMFATSAGMKGLATAAFISRVGLLGVAGVMGLTVTALSALTALFFRHRTTLDELQPVNEKTADGFVKIDKALSQAKISLAAYNSAMEDYNDNQIKLQKIRAIHRYHERKGTTGSWAELFDELPYMTATSDMAVPNKLDYFENPSDTSMVNAATPMMNSKTNVSFNSKPIEIILKNPSGGVLGGTTLNLKPEVKSTSTY